MGITPIHNKSISEEVLEQIKGNILSGDWKPGDKIPGEIELSESFCVSRVSIRQAIHTLVGMGILTVKRGEGTYISEVVPARYFDRLLSMVIMEMPEYMEVQEFRLSIEPSIARLATMKATKQDLAALKKSVESLKSLKGNSQGFAAEDINFHRILAESTHNKLIIKTNSIIMDLMNAAMEQAVKITGFNDSINDHTKIYNCVKNGKPEVAEQLMRQHIESNIIKLSASD